MYIGSTVGSFVGTNIDTYIRSTVGSDVGTNIDMYNVHCTLDPVLEVMLKLKLIRTLDPLLEVMLELTGSFWQPPAFFNVWGTSIQTTHATLWNVHSQTNALKDK